MAKKNTSSISLILAVYNEINIIEKAVKYCNEVLSRDFEDFEIILVDDGSVDGTGDVMEEFVKGNSRIRVVHNNINLNLGISILRALALSTKDYVVYNAVDLPLDPKDITWLIEKYIIDCDVLVLERKIYSGATLWRKIASKVNRAFIRILFPIASRGIKDMNFTQFFRREVIKNIMPLARSPAFTPPEMILRARYKGLRVKSVLVDYWPRTLGKGAFGKPHDILWSLYDMFRFRLKSWKK